jgi:hypothetical protein
MIENKGTPGGREGLNDIEEGFFDLGWGIYEVLYGIGDLVEGRGGCTDSLACKFDALDLRGFSGGCLIVILSNESQVGIPEVVTRQSYEVLFPGKILHSHDKRLSACISSEDLVKKDFDAFYRDFDIDAEKVHCFKYNLLADP